MKILITGLAALLLLSYCADADTLGEEPPVNLAVQDTPTWKNGVGNLLTTKCGYCHASPRPETAPANVTADLDLTVYETRIVDGRVIRGADSVGVWFNEGILEHDVPGFADGVPVRKMPLDYGTPITEDELHMLHAWDFLGSPKNDETPERLKGDANHGYYLFVHGNCVSCHGSDARGVKDSDGLYLGPPIRREQVTDAKMRSMWMSKVLPFSISDQDCADLRVHLESLFQEQDQQDSVGGR